MENRKPQTGSSTPRHADRHPLPPRHILLVLLRGLRKRCPQCGAGPIYARWYALVDRCPRCGLPIAVEDGNTWVFMYLSTAFLTGVLLALMFLIRPQWLGPGRMILFAAAMLLILGTLPVRKSLALAIDYLITLRWDNPAGRALRRDGE